MDEDNTETAGQAARTAGESAMASLRERIRMRKRRAQQARGKRGMTMRILLQHGHLDGWGYQSLNQGREKKSSMVVAGLTRPGKKSGQGTLELIKQSVQIILEKWHFPSSLLLWVCRRKGWPAGFEQRSRDCALG